MATFSSGRLERPLNPNNAGALNPEERRNQSKEHQHRNHKKEQIATNKTRPPVKESFETLSTPYDFDEHLFYANFPKCCTKHELESYGYAANTEAHEDGLDFQSNSAQKSSMTSDTTNAPPLVDNDSTANIVVVEDDDDDAKMYCRQEEEELHNNFLRAASKTEESRLQVMKFYERFFTTTS